MAKWNKDGLSPVYQERSSVSQPVITEPILSPAKASSATSIYADSPGEMNFVTLQQNLQDCLSIVDSEVMKSYVPSLQNCQVVPLDKSILPQLNEAARAIQFFRITELVYQENEFSVHKLATMFSALANKPVTLVLMIQSDGQNNEFYLGVRSRGSFSTGTMRKMLEQSLLGLFPGSKTQEYLSEDLQKDLKKIATGSVSSVTCIADYKQDKTSLENKEFVQGLEKFICSMQGKPFTGILLANNLAHQDLVETRKEYERIYTMLSPFSTMQYNYTLNQSQSTSKSDTRGTSETDSTGTTEGQGFTFSRAEALSRGTNQSRTLTDTQGINSSVTSGKSYTKGYSDSVSDSTTNSKTSGSGSGNGFNFLGISLSASVFRSTGHSTTHGTSHTNSVSDTVSENLTKGISSSSAVGNTSGTSLSRTTTDSLGTSAQKGTTSGHSTSSNYAQTKALADTFGHSQAVTLNVQNKALRSTLDRLEKQLHRLDECESCGMWDFAAYFLGESAAETETAANMYRSLVSGNQSGLELTAVNTWTEKRQIAEISQYVKNFLHPIFCYQFNDGSLSRKTLVDATALSSTRELAIQLGLPRNSVKGLPVIQHAAFAQEILGGEHQDRCVRLGCINHLGRETDTRVSLDLQSLAMHTFITGSTGSGKSNTIYQILSQIKKQGVHFLVVEPAKGEYRSILGNSPDISVYGTNPMLSSVLRINPFSFPRGIHIYEHLDRLVEIFNVCWPMYAAMPAVLKDAIERAYIAAGWDLRRSKNKYSDRLFPNFGDVLHQVNLVMEQSQYSSDNKNDYTGALCTRLRSLTNGINSLVFTSDELSGEELFDRNVIVDLSRVGSSETKALMMGLLVMKLQEHRMACCTGMNLPLHHITVLEEAHNLLKLTSTEQLSEGANLLGKSVEMLTNAIAEMRTYGEGFIIADQSPGLLDMSVIRNTNTKIIMRLPDYSDRELVGRAAGLNDEQIAELSKLGKGIAAVYQNDWLEAVLCKVDKYIPDSDATSPLPPAEWEDTPDLKGNIISRMIQKNIWHLVETTDEEEILRANIPAPARCALLEYCQTPVQDRMISAAGIAYHLFCADQAFAEMDKHRPTEQNKVRFLSEHLIPSLTALPEDSSRILLYLIIYYRVCTTPDPEYRLLLDSVLPPKKEATVHE